jgi:L-alanine-DL-glutamate epimerase-like enolase superfamily enzyme
MDVAIIDMPWNGIWQGHKIAAMAEAYEINIAPHNFYGHLSNLMICLYHRERMGTRRDDCERTPAIPLTPKPSADCRYKR